MKSLFFIVMSSLLIAQEEGVISKSEIDKAEQPLLWKIQKEISVKEGLRVPLLFFFTQKGNGSVQIANGTWVGIYDCHDDGYVFEPFLMNQKLIDVNSDGYKDIVFSANLIETGEKETDPQTNLGTVYVQLLYDISKNGFKLGEHSNAIQPFAYCVE